MTHEQYLSDKALLDDLNQRIDLASSTAKPVFRGIVELHMRVKQYEARHATLTNG